MRYAFDFCTLAAVVSEAVDFWIGIAMIALLVAIVVSRAFQEWKFRNRKDDDE